MKTGRIAGDWCCYCPCKGLDVFLVLNIKLLYCSYVQQLILMLKPLPHFRRHATKRQSPPRRTPKRCRRPRTPCGLCSQEGHRPQRCDAPQNAPCTLAAHKTRNWTYVDYLRARSLNTPPTHIGPIKAPKTARAASGQNQAFKAGLGKMANSSTKVVSCGASLVDLSESVAMTIEHNINEHCVACFPLFDVCYRPSTLRPNFL